MDLPLIPRPRSIKRIDESAPTGAAESRPSLPSEWETQLSAWLNKAARDGIKVSLSVSKEIKPQGYILRTSKDACRMEASDPAGAFYALQTVEQLRRLLPELPPLLIEDWPDYPLRGTQWDVARDGLLTMPQMKALVDLLALTKQNCLMLYNEDCFFFEKHPRIGHDAARLSADDIRELDAYCRERFITLVPNLAVFGHMRNILRLPEYEHLADNRFLWSIAPGEDETYRFLDDLLDEYLPCFSAPFFHANCDETWDLENLEGKSAPAARERGLGPVYVDHLARVSEIAARHGKKTVFWSDMMVKYRDSLHLLPADLIPDAWGYEGRMEFPILGGRKEQWVSPSVSSHNSLFCRLDDSRMNIYMLARAGAGLSGFVNTIWRNGWRRIIGRPEAHGRELYDGYSAMFNRPLPPKSLPAACWAGICYGAECSWHLPRRNDETFYSRLLELFFGVRRDDMAEGLELLGRTYLEAGLDSFDQSGLDRLFADDPADPQMSPLTTPARMEKMLQMAGQAASAWERPPSGGMLDPLFADEFLLMAERTSWAARKTLGVLRGGADWQKLAAERASLVQRDLAAMGKRFQPRIVELAAAALHKGQDAFTEQIRGL